MPLLKGHPKLDSTTPHTFCSQKRQSTKVVVGSPNRGFLGLTVQEDEEQLRRGIYEKVRETDLNLTQDLMTDLRRNLRL